MVFPYSYTPVENLIDGQLATNGITHAGIIDAIRSVPRELFVPESFRHTAYVDEEIPVGAGRVMIEPLLLATLLQHLDPKPHESVMVIGGGSGYSAALLSHLVARVELVEENPALAHAAEQLFRQLGLPNVTLAQHALTHGAPATAPYDAILIEGAVQVIPEAISSQLKVGGRLLVCEQKHHAPGTISGLAQIMVYDCYKDGTLSARSVGDTSASLLPGFAAAPQFQFYG
jgi:protein-L-isoaspartate(D-aspartate) O-methyltransferase